MRILTFVFRPALCCILVLAYWASDSRSVCADTPFDQFAGQWWFDFPDGYGGWLDVAGDAADPQIQLLWRVGSPRAIRQIRWDNDQLVMTRKRRDSQQVFVAKVRDQKIHLRLLDSDQSASGQRCPPMPPRPDLSKVRFGREINLFNGRDLSQWQLQPPTAMNGWRAENGVLINETPKTDFSAYGSYGNLRSVQTFEDCQLHIEFNVGTKGNSGIYVRGLYEVQVVDRDSPMQGISGPGAVFGRIAPTHNAGLPGGRWQSYDITLVDRHMTVILNGEKVIDNQPVLGCTGGALFGDVSRPGPVYLQGDHTSVRYRNIRIRPRVKP